MVVTIDMLKGTNLKRSLQVYKVAKLYHNKNSSGGNFGIIIRPNNNKYDFDDVSTHGVELTGYHNLTGTIYSMRLGELNSRPIAQLITRENYSQVTYNDVVSAVHQVLVARSSQ